MTAAFLVLGGCGEVLLLVADPVYGTCQGVEQSLDAAEVADSLADPAASGLVQGNVPAGGWRLRVGWRGGRLEGQSGRGRRYCRHPRRQPAAA